MIKIEFDTDNAAFLDNENEVSHVLKRLIDGIPDLKEWGSLVLFDSNGNSVGHATYTTYTTYET